MTFETILWPVIGIGIASSLKLLYDLFDFISLHLRSSSISRYHHGDSTWAIVTGASDGIGLAFAQELSRRGFNIVLHGRNPLKLADCQARLEKEFSGRQYRIFLADVTQDSIPAMKKFIGSARDIRLTVLVNNVGGTKGFLDTDFKTLASHRPTEIANLSAANMQFSTTLTAALLSILAQNQPSLILNIGSISAGGMPYLSVYAATKAYIAAWSFGLKAEMEAEGLDIEVHNIESGTTQSGQNRTPERLTNPTAITFARAAIAKVGCGRVVVTGWWPHHLQKMSLEMMPEWAQRSVLVAALKPMVGKGLATWSKSNVD